MNHPERDEEASDGDDVVEGDEDGILWTLPWADAYDNDVSGNETGSSSNRTWSPKRVKFSHLRHSVGPATET